VTRITIVGAGISGPACALALAAHGHTVNVHDRRAEHEINSYGVIGILEEICGRLREFDADIQKIALDNLYHELTLNGMETHRMSTQKFVVWSEIHRVLVEAAEKAGARFHYRSTPKPRGVTVQASGLGYARWRGLKADLRYVVYRGLSDIPTDYSWLSLNDPDKRFSFKLARHIDGTKVGSTWELYAHREDIKTYSQDETTLPDECVLLPSEFQAITHRTKKLATSAISDWEVPDSLRDVTSGVQTITIGDANGGMRPHTGMGANLGIAEALSVPDLIMFNSDSNAIERSHIQAREYQRERGINMGKAVMGR
jgi:2-polyprenyl-6-methoxyphenol hydroxylase-like FAD-dependent oxidoreductase